MCISARVIPATRPGLKMTSEIICRNCAHWDCLFRKTDAQGWCEVNDGALMKPTSTCGNWYSLAKWEEENPDDA